MVIFKCDGCGKEEHGFYSGRSWLKPAKWYARNIQIDGYDDQLLACSRNCMDKIDEEMGEKVPVIPV